MSGINCRLTCQSCQQEFVRTSKRGRPPRNCPSCTIEAKREYFRIREESRTRDYSKKRRETSAFVCVGCHKERERHIRRDGKDSGLYCGRQCYFDHKSLVSKEISLIREMGKRSRAYLRPSRPTKKEPITKPAQIRKAPCCICGQEVELLKGKQKASAVCGEACRVERERRIREERKATESWRSARRRYKSSRRAKERGADADPIDPIEVFERAGWRCYLCGVETPIGLRGTNHDDAPELEHVIPLARGGSHTWANVACACRKCNIRKGDSDPRGRGASLGWLASSFLTTPPSSFSRPRNMKSKE